jgi:DnaK suppressor protein
MGTPDMNKKKMQSLEKQLRTEVASSENELEQIDEQIRSYTEDTDLGEPADNHPGDQADNLYERERLMTIREGLAERKSEIQHALDKIGEGRYGDCERCGEPIAVERLEALPFARHCIACQEIVEQTGAGRR